MDNTRKHLPEWVREGIITGEQAGQIEAWLEARQGRGISPLTVLAAIGSLMTGIGILLIVAHNWDQMPHAARLFFALLPAVLGAALTAFAVLKKSGSTAWNESAGILHLAGLGASVSLISQVYQISGSMESFLLIWLLLAAPVMFLTRSMAAGFLFLLLATGFAGAAGYSFRPQASVLHYLWMLAAWAAFTWQSLKFNRHAAWYNAFSWLFPLSVCLAVGTSGRHSAEPAWLWQLYTVLMGCFLWAAPFFSRRFPSLSRNGLTILPRLGLLIIVTLFSYKFFWKDLFYDELFRNNNFLREPGFWVSVGAWMALAAVSIRQYMLNLQTVAAETWVALAFVLSVWLFGKLSPEAGTLLTNALLIITGFYLLRKGIKADRLDQLNYGMLWLAVFVVCRFFDFKLGYLFRGLFFIALGLILFGVNYYLLRQRKGQKA